MTGPDAEALAAELAAEMARRWQAGERPLTEAFLDRHPELRDHPAAAADLIYEERRLRQELGPDLPLDQLLDRFPQWRPQLAMLFACQELLGPVLAPPRFPTAGEAVGDFLLAEELGRGGQGRVFLAFQRSLGDRPVVLKFTPDEGGEHLSLARLQHTHVVPLYAAYADPERGLRILCMPYFGGASLARLLDDLRPRPVAQRTARDLVAGLGPERAGWSYADAVGWVGACLADALGYAHERGLVHLDLKPANVLIAADGTPMVLDFHLARPPLDPGRDERFWLGGTAGYLSPEQRAAMADLEQGRRPTRAVDGRSDVYSLGLVLYEALAGRLPETPGPPYPLPRLNPQVSVGLGDVVARCLAEAPGDRYPDMAALAEDLRRHLADLPLAGVRNRSAAERWRKWRRRRPHGLALAGTLLSVFAAAGAVALGAVTHYVQRLDQAARALHDGQAEAARGHWDGARRTLGRGLAAARGLPGQGELAEELARQVAAAEAGRRAAARAAAGAELHRLADRVRTVYGADPLPPAQVRSLAAACRALWDQRRQLAEGSGPAATDLLDLAICLADLEGRSDRRAALAVLIEAEELLGPNAVLAAERHGYGGPEPDRLEPAGAWGHYALGRALLRIGDLQRAGEELAQAVRLDPGGLWPQFYRGLWAFRSQRFEEAALAYSVCLGAAPEVAGCWFNRALALEALGRADQALADYDQALRLEPTLAAAALNRGLLHYRARRYAPALADLRRAQALGADPAAVALDAALVHLAAGDRAAAVTALRQALAHDPRQAEARQLLNQVEGGPGARGRTPPE